MGCVHHKMRIQITQGDDKHMPSKRIPSVSPKLVVSSERKWSLFAISEASSCLEESRVRRFSKLSRKNDCKQPTADSRRLSLLSIDESWNLSSTYRPECDC
ncbi:unnamed protein product [Blepharisma stoltei]|uniref:Uncharacterized protein n=1 Tax=Blepharisma stoltei TaxID=1481888 RepID=A0AAU9IY17_9CILI|nr:unnamed protein product [Blepharisma stoltei]